MEIPHTVLILALVVFGFLFGLLEAPGLPSSLVVIPLGSDGGVVVCAIVFRNATRGIECSMISSVGKVGETFPLHPSINYSSLSVGHGSLCGLEFDGTSFYYWKLTNNGSSNGTRVYHNGTVPLRDLVVGESQVAASDLNGTFIQWWLAGRDFPTKLLGSFHSHTSGAGFTCAIDGSNDAAMCWGPRSQQIQATFADQRMSTIVAGRYGACGVTKEGRLLCSSRGSNFRQLSFEFESLSLGSNHTCVIRSLNRTLVCWGAGGDDYFPAESSSFIFLVANDNLFCGLTDMSYDIHCWRTDRSPSPVVELPLYPVVPGVCVKNSSSCRQGIIEDSSRYCLNSGVVCMPSTTQPQSSHRSRLGIEWIVLGCVGFALMLLCLSGLLCLLVSKMFPQHWLLPLLLLLLLSPPQNHRRHIALRWASNGSCSVVSALP